MYFAGSDYVLLDYFREVTCAEPPEGFRLSIVMTGQLLSTVPWMLCQRRRGDMRFASIIRRDLSGDVNYGGWSTRPVQIGALAFS